MSIHGRYGFRYDDCLVLASALAGGAKTLLSGDLQHGQRISFLVVENPLLK
jgi:predicted nucleic acid-binding protein